MSKYWYKLKYVGKSFGIDELTNGKIYSAVPDDTGMYRVVDDSDEDYLYDMTNPAPTDGSLKGGKWEIIEEIECGSFNKKLLYVSEADKKLSNYDDKMTLKNFLSNNEIENKEQIIEYLYNGTIVDMKDNVKDNVLDDEIGAINTEVWRMDGKYIWSSFLIYYFINNNMKLEPEFLSYISNKI